jgi:hypothetical protein
MANIVAGILMTAEEIIPIKFPFELKTPPPEFP